MRERSILSIAVLAVALVAGCAKAPDDAALVTNIKSQMFSDQQLKNADLQVTSANGQVTLSGSVPSDAARLDAYKIATQTPGVTKVNDQMTVEAAQAAAEPPIAPAPEPRPAREEKHERKAHLKSHQPAPAATESAANIPPPDPTPPQAPPQPVAPPAPAPAPPPPQPKLVRIPENTTVTIRMIDGVDSSVNHPGEIFHASLEAPLVVDDQVVVPKGADIYVRLVAASSAGKYTGKSELHLELVKLEFRGQSYPLVSSTYTLSGGSRGKNTAEKVGGAAAVGAIIGALAGGGKGAAIGAGVGGAGGGVYQGLTHGKQVRIPSETKLDFQLDQPLTVSVMPRSAPAAQ
ncbi:MAG TPA: BON domain-containing protein [Candidatus Acidoferrales bacterium]|nr:BON domain-containing protein [Candidatus Acidoferrales bacterium]